MGRRVVKTVSEWDGSTWVQASVKLFVYDGWNLIEEITNGTTQTSKYYVWGLDLSQSLQGAGCIGGLVASVDNTGEIRYYLYDANGNVGQLVKPDGSIAAHYEYDPYGNIVYQYGDEADSNVFRFSTRFFDIETGLYYYGYRDYVPDLGRWGSMDPIREKGGVNLYLFILNNPTNYYDKLGLECSDTYVLPKYTFDALKKAMSDTNSSKQLLEQGALVMFHPMTREVKIKWAEKSDRYEYDVIIPEPSPEDTDQGFVPVANLHTHGGGIEYNQFSGIDVMGSQNKLRGYTSFLITDFSIQAILVIDWDKFMNCPTGSILDKFIPKEGILNIYEALKEMMECCGICYYKGSTNGRTLSLQK